MIDTIFYFIDSLTFEEYLRQVGSQIAERTIVFAKDQQSIYMGGKMFGAGNISDIESQLLSLLDDPDVVNKLKNIIRNYFDQNPSSITTKASNTDYGVVKIKLNGGILVNDGEISIDPSKISTAGGGSGRSILNVQHLSTSGLVDTYQINYTDGLSPDTFTVTNGAQGENGSQGPKGNDGAAATITVGRVSTLPAGYSATVTNSGTPNAAILDFGIPKGHDGDGGDGSGVSKYYEQAFKTTTQIYPEPEVPANGFPNANDGWNRYAENSDGTKYVWMCTRLVNGSGEALESWTGPWLISGPGGQPGEDGKGIEFVYTRTYSNSISQTLANSLNAEYGTTNTVDGKEFQDQDFVPSGWTDNPEGVDIDYPYEWAAVRTSDSEGEWSSFTGPILWSHYGQNGMDGDGVEYIFYANTTGTIPSGQYPDEWEASQDNEYTGPSNSQWTDDPWDLETLGQGAKEWVSIRKKREINGVHQWGTFSAPALWATFARDGVADGYTVDLTNENMPVGTTAEGDVTNYSNNCGIQVFHNGSPITNFTVTVGTITRSDGLSVTGIAATVDNSTKNVAVTMNNVANFAAINAFIPVTVDITGGPTRNLTITLFGIATGEAGSAIDLWTDASAIRTDYEQTTAVPAKLKVGVKVSSASTGLHIYSANSSDSDSMGFSYRYYYDDNSANPTSLSSGNQITIAPDHSSITVQMIYSGQVVDVETIPYVKDGAPYIGAGPIVYNVNVISSSCRAYRDSNSDFKYDGTVKFTVTKRTDDGTVQITTNPNVATGNDNERISVTIGGSAVTPTYTSGSWTASISTPQTYTEGVTESFAQIRVTNGSSTVVASQVVPFAVQGQPGPIGVTGRAKFKSTCFIRTNKNLEASRPTGGDYSSPIPTSTVYDNGTALSWSDGIPAGDKQLWATTRSFTSDGVGQDANWEYPRKMTDTTTYDVEFALEQSGGGIPNDPDETNRHKDTYPNSAHPDQIWFDPSKDSWQDFTNMCWRAERVNVNGDWSDWTILRIKGEKGDRGQDGVTTYVTQPLEGVVMRFRGWDVTDTTSSAYIANSDYIEDGTTADSNGVKFMDVVYTNGGSYYRIKTRSLRSSVNAPESVVNGVIQINTAQWVEFAPSADAAFQNIIARNAFIQNLTGREIIITDSNNNPVAGLTGSQAITGDGGENLTAAQRGDIRIWAGSPTVGNNTSLTNCPFRVTAGGELTATNAAIFGSLTAISGNNRTEVSPTDGIKQTVSSNVTNWLKQDGSGQLASGNITWGTTGATTIKGTIQTGDPSANVYAWMMAPGAHYATLYLANTTKSVVNLFADATNGGCLELSHPTNNTGVQLHTTSLRFSTTANTSDDVFRFLYSPSTTSSYFTIGSSSQPTHQFTVLPSSKQASYAITVDNSSNFIQLSASDATQPRITLTGSSGTNIISPTGQTANSDMRLKDVVATKELSAEQIADAPIFTYTPKANPDANPIIGTSAQYWQNVLPETVSEQNEYLLLDYTKVATASVINLAKEVVSLKAEIESLKQQIAELKNA